MYLNNLSPYVRVAWDSMIEYPFQILDRSIYDYEILYVKEGDIEVTIKDHIYYGCSGDLFIFKPKESHSIKLLNNKRLHQPHIHFDFYYQSDSPKVKVSYQSFDQMTTEEKLWFRKDIIKNIPNHLKLNNPLTVEKIIFDIIHAMERKLPFYETISKGLFIQLWVQILRELHWKKFKHLATNFEELERFKNFISHHADRDITLDELSDIANLDKYYLGRLFKKTYGYTPIQYHIMTRFEKAKQLLQFTNLTITEISEKLGFRSIHSFSRGFRKYEGISPSYFRKRK